MAGRAAILQLLPFSVSETSKVNLLYGGFPEVLARPESTRTVVRFVSADVPRTRRSRHHKRTRFGHISAIHFPLATRHGQVLNKTDLAAPLGVSVPTIGEWLRILEMTGQIILVPPYFENFGKRIIKSSEAVLGGFRAGMLSPGYHLAKRARTLAISRAIVRGICSVGNSQKPGQSGRA